MDKKILLSGAAALVLGVSMYSASASASALSLTIEGEGAGTATMSDAACPLPTFDPSQSPACQLEPERNHT